jgi:hypothetical protein
MSALFDFRSFLVVILLSICTCTYVKMRAPQVRRPPGQEAARLVAFVAEGLVLCACQRRADARCARAPLLRS